MKKKLRMLSAFLIVLFIITLPIASVLAQENYSLEEMGIEGEGAGFEVLPSEARPPEKAEFGAKDYCYTWIPACQFTQHTTVGITSHPGGYNGRANLSSDPFFTAAINLPTGVDIWDIRLYFYDVSSSNILLWYWRNSTSSPGTSTTFKTLQSSGTPGYSTLGFDPYPNHIFDNYHQYVIRLRLDDVGSSLRFKGVRIKYRRIISDAPATATFSDVPTTHAFFKNIEALAASGITTGYSDGTYRPKEYVTREQMAAFLSRALGLHHTDPN